MLNITHQIKSTSRISHLTNPSQSEASISKCPVPVDFQTTKLPNSFQRCVSSKFPRRHQNVSPVWSGPAVARNVSAAHLVMSPSAVAPSHSSSMNYIILLLYRQTVYSGPGHTHTAFLVFRLNEK